MVKEKSEAARIGRARLGMKETERSKHLQSQSVSLFEKKKTKTNSTARLDNFKKKRKPGGTALVLPLLLTCSISHQQPFKVG